MNRAFDERLELQLQEYEFAELDQMMPVNPLIQAVPEDENSVYAMEAIVNRH
jgi:hypothetical protein